MNSISTFADILIMVVLDWAGLGRFSGLGFYLQDWMGGVTPEKEAAENNPRVKRGQLDDIRFRPRS